MFKKLWAIPLLTCMLSPAYADETIMLKAGYASISSSGQISSSSAGIVGSALNLDNTLAMTKSSNVTLEAAIQLGDSRFGISYMPLKFSGTKTVTTPVQFNGTAFTNNVKSTLDSSIIDLSYTYFLINMDDIPSRLQIGIESSLKFVSSKAMLSSTGLSQEVSANLPIPTIGVRARVALADLVGITANVGYLGYGGNSFLDAQAQIEFSPLPTIGIYAGYRQIALKIDKVGLKVDTTFAGPFAGAFFRF